MKVIESKVQINAECRTIYVSFYGGDQYYYDSANKLEKDMQNIGESYHFREVLNDEGESWAVLCAYKIEFLRDMRELYPEKVIVWIDIDSRLIESPNIFSSESIDFMAFARGFSHPLKVGYINRSRFFEPSLTAWFPTPMGNKLLEVCYKLYCEDPENKTDDYFLEEAWRSLSEYLCWAFIPSRYSDIGCRRSGFDNESVFFLFGSSGSVNSNVSKVIQHKKPSIISVSSMGAKRLNPKLVSIHKRIEKLIQKVGGAKMSTRYNRLALRAHQLVLKEAGTVRMKNAGSSKKQHSKHKKFNQVYEKILTTSSLTEQSFSYFDKVCEAYNTSGLIDQSKVEQIRAVKAYRDLYNTAPVKLTWWHQPAPGNFGDWLSPLVFGHSMQRAIQFSHPKAGLGEKRIVGIGSIARFADEHSIVVGAGFSANDLSLVNDADYVSVRGPLTAEMVRKKTGKIVESFGDPGLLVRRLISEESLKEMADSISAPSKPICYISHFAAEKYLPFVSRHCDLVSIKAATPYQLKLLMAKLFQYEYVITTAMHIVIACQSYGIPVVFLKTRGNETISGDGMKYTDYAEGAGLDFPIYTLDEAEAGLSGLEKYVTSAKASEAVLDNITKAMLVARDRFECQDSGI